MISKAKFVDYMKYIEALRQKEELFNRGLAKCFGEQNVSDIFVFSEVETEFIKMLCDLMNIKYNEYNEFGDDIQYFIYELDFGRAKMAKTAITEGDITYDLSSASKLYDYIVSKAKNAKLTNRIIK